MALCIMTLRWWCWCWEHQATKNYFPPVLNSYGRFLKHSPRSFFKRFFSGATLGRKLKIATDLKTVPKGLCVQEEQRQPTSGQKALHNHFDISTYVYVKEVVQALGQSMPWWGTATVRWLQVAKFVYFYDSVNKEDRGEHSTLEIYHLLDLEAMWHAQSALLFMSNMIGKFKLKLFEAKLDFLEFVFHNSKVSGTNSKHQTCKSHFHHQDSVPLSHVKKWVWVQKFCSEGKGNLLKYWIWVVKSCPNLVRRWWIMMTIVQSSHSPTLTPTKRVTLCAAKPMDFSVTFHQDSFSTSE